MASGHDSGEETSVERPVRAYRRVRLGQLVEVVLMTLALD